MEPEGMIVGYRGFNIEALPGDDAGELFAYEVVGIGLDTEDEIWSSSFEFDNLDDLRMAARFDIDEWWSKRGK